MCNPSLSMGCARDQAQSVARDCARDQAQSVPGIVPGIKPRVSPGIAPGIKPRVSPGIAPGIKQAQSVPGSRQGVVAWDSLERRGRKMLRGGSTQAPIGETDTTSTGS